MKIECIGDYKDALDKLQNNAKVMAQLEADRAEIMQALIHFGAEHFRKECDEIIKRAEKEEGDEE